MMSLEYNFNLKNDSKINLKDENFIFLHIKYINNIIYINSKTSRWILEKRINFKSENFDLNLKLFQNYALIECNPNLKYKHFYEVDLSYFKELNFNSNVSLIKQEKEFNLVKYSDYLKDKRVVIVAPGGYLKDMNNGINIDNYDIVVRLNTALPLKESMKNILGSKTNILYNCLNKGEHNGGIIDFENLELDWISCPYPNIYPFKHDNKRFHQENKNKFKFHIIDKYYYINLEKEMGTRPNTGIGAILDLLKFPLKELYITGFTFLLESGYLDDYKSFLNTQEKLDRLMETNCHDRIKQVKYIKPILLNNSRVKLDQELISILDKI